MDIRNRIAKRVAAYFKPGDVVNLGIGMPSLCPAYSDPGVMFHTENGLIGVGPLSTGLRQVESFTNASGQQFLPLSGASAFDSAESFAIVRSGRLAATVLGALQVAENGDLANWARPGKMVGMGGAMDLVTGAPKVIIAMELCARGGEKKILKACTFPLTGRACVDHIVTEQGVIDVTARGLVLTDIVDGVTPQDIARQIEPELIVADDLRIMEA
ncbi:acetyl-CoA:acetoacetyl-CoA transferase, beta subunit [uncultured Pleomorphomonas sp.]|uniref:Acetyl-CoA:acetoacetyl-CoA transferase, beta subunit n=1 Tax=uncultured Pleomorphomonas sp. TaxID=442121 RepID=A0A212LES0_9HYPH|nr:CoA-transferase [uncultured Pleomorphomonas sp.]SCM76052.1 acetyl-CoA:acetoacetyl-CoA transferase, beta subunit [uncultured Pleomorphomonas sp.]